MTKLQMIDLVKQYFQGVDAKDFSALAETLDDDCILSVETHGARFQGIAEIEPMFGRLWDNHATVRHHNFIYIPDPEAGRIATQFSVVNTHPDGSETHKSNCNFFNIQNGRFSRIAVYMAGDNTLKSD